MDSDCLICFKSHPSIDCPERTKQHCPDCHVLIQHCSNHTSVCGLKNWQFNKYASVYAKEPKPRCAIGFNAPFRFLKDGDLRKGSEGLHLYSPETGAMFRFDSDNDLILLTTTFSAIRLVIVVKEKDGDTEVFRKKLLLLTQMKNIIVASELNDVFDRHAPTNTHGDKTSLILVVSAVTYLGLRLSLVVYPINGALQNYELQYELDTKKFIIPEALNVESIARAAMNANPPNYATNQIAKFGGDDGPFPWQCPTCVGAHHSTECHQPKLENCFECHAPTKSVNDHAPVCGVKTWFISKPINVYVDIPAIRCTFSFKSPVYYGYEQPAYAGLELFSSVSDTLFIFASDSEVSLYTTRFTRVRFPIVLRQNFNSMYTYTEKAVFLTSHDRSIVIAQGSRQVNPVSILQGYEHNTPLVFYILEKQDPSVSVDVFSIGGTMRTYEIKFDRNINKYVVPAQLNVNSQNFLPMKFDGQMPIKPKSK